MVVEELTWYSDPHCHQTTDWIDAAGISNRVKMIDH